MHFSATVKRSNAERRGVVVQPHLKQKKYILSTPSLVLQQILLVPHRIGRFFGRYRRTGLGNIQANYTSVVKSIEMAKNNLVND